MTVEISTDDVFETVEYTGLDRPEYILKNGRAFNIYRALKYIQAQQKRIKELEKLNLSFAMKEHQFNCKHVGAPVHPQK